SARPYPLDVSAWIVPGISRMVTDMLDNLGLRTDFGEILPEAGGVVRRFRPVLPRPTLRTLTAPARVLPRVRRFDAAMWSADPRFACFRREVDELAATDLRTLGWAELVRLPRRALAATRLLTALRVDYFPRVGVTLLLLRLLLKALRLSELFAMLTAGAPTRTSDTNCALEDLAARVRADAFLRQAFADMTPSELLENITADPRFDDFATAFRGFVAEYGHRETTSPLLVSEPTWADAPATVLGIVSLLAEQPPETGRRNEPAMAMRRLLRHRLVRATRSRHPVEHLVAAARAGVAMREDTHFHLTEAIPLLRHVALECGRRLADAGVLSDADDVWHLRLEELENIGEPVTLSAADAERLRRAVAERTARRAELVGVPMITAVELAAPSRQQPDPDALVHGTGASGGRATGPARVISGPERFSALRPGDVLVCPYTNPAWTPLFQRAAAVVVDSGGLASHAAIVAREYGIPAVMGTVRGTSVLTDAQRVTVDGDRGSVSAA
ncbi:MAG: PEP-utilizing enzyme, partial [Actinomycetes bacterium]